MTTREEIIYASFGRIITDISASLQQQTWFQLTESENTIDDSILLREHVGLTHNDWRMMLRVCQIDSAGGTFQRKGWETFFATFSSACSGYKNELDRRKIDNKATWFVMLGPTAVKGCKNASVQIRSKIKCPIMEELSGLRNELKNLLNQYTSGEEKETEPTQDDDRSKQSSNDSSDSDQADNNDPKSDDDDLNNDNNSTAQSSMFKGIDISKLSDGELSYLVYMASQETKARATKAAGVTKLKSWSFGMKNRGNDAISNEV
eukprot:scaffold17649_cov40-Cyclotella_meneghiniana.AAC.1